MRDKDSGAITKIIFPKDEDEVRFVMETYFDTKPEMDECRSVFTSIIDDCSLPDPKTNPRNVKVGGTMATKNGFRYHIVPWWVRKHPPERDHENKRDRCHRVD
ncbi:hypothetical protein IMZ48_40495 [Candidatus Bathyarchaeota archaeon]|nr:hypothetical protein [Candidatus Bathyarchaeota archaeon]